MNQGYLETKDVSVADLKGTAKTSNKACSIWPCSSNYSNIYLVARVADTCSSPAPFNKWVDQDVAPRASSFLPLYQEGRADNLVWRTMRSASELRWLQLVEMPFSAQFGNLRSRRTPKPVFCRPMHSTKAYLQEELSSITVQRTLEQSEVVA